MSVPHAKHRLSVSATMFPEVEGGQGPEGIRLLVLPCSPFTQLMRTLITFYKNISKTARGCVCVCVCVCAFTREMNNHACFVSKVLV